MADHQSDTEMKAWCVRVNFKISRKSRQNGNGCLIWRGAQRSVPAHRSAPPQYGQISCRVPGSKRRTMKSVHRVVYMAHTGNFDLPRECDVSHLCHNSLCVLFEQLSLEPRGINNMRKTCRRLKVCQGHGDFKNCILL